MPDTRISLILRLPRSADHEAWREFVEIYEPLIFRFARRRGLQDADACDLVQRVFSSVASAVERWSPDAARGRFRAWLFRIARNHLINQVKSRRKERPVGGTTQMFRLADAIVDSNYAGDEIELEYQRALFEVAAERIRQSVKKATWDAFWQTSVLEQDAELVARSLNISVGAVYIARSRVISRLKNLIQDMEAEQDALHE